MELNIVLQNIKRICYVLLHRCVVCGGKVNCKRNKKTYIRNIDKNVTYCSLECACYDGAFSVKKGWTRKPKIWKT